MLIIAVVLISGCKKGGEPAVKDGYLVVTSFYPVYVIAKNVADGVEGVRVVNMTPPMTGCLHDYSVTSADMKNLEHADIFLYNGAGMESFIDKIAAKYPALKSSPLSKGITPLKGIGGDNPHVWVSISNAVVMTENCASVLSESDSRNAGRYKRNAANYVKQLKALKNEMDSALGRFRGRKIITFHEAFPYFAKDFGLQIAAVVEHEPGIGPSAKEIAETVELVRRMKIRVLFAEPQYPSSSAGLIARETGARVYMLDPAVTGPDETDAYIKIMKKNRAVLEDAFSEK